MNTNKKMDQDKKQEKVVEGGGKHGSAKQSVAVSSDRGSAASNSTSGRASQSKQSDKEISSSSGSGKSKSKSK